MNVEKHVLNGDPKFVEISGSSNKLKDHVQHMHQEPSDDILHFAH